MTKSPGSQLDPTPDSHLTTPCPHDLGRRGAQPRQATAEGQGFPTATPTQSSWPEVDRLDELEAEWDHHPATPPQIQRQYSVTHSGTRISNEQNASVKFGLSDDFVRNVDEHRHGLIRHGKLSLAVASSAHRDSVVAASPRPVHFDAKQRRYTQLP